MRHVCLETVCFAGCSFGLAGSTDTACWRPCLGRTLCSLHIAAAGSAAGTRSCSRATSQMRRLAQADSIVTPCCMLKAKCSCSFLLQENASRPDHVPPNQGGKYVGFGSTPPPAPRRGPGGNPSQGGEDVGAYLSKGLSQLSTAAGDMCPTVVETLALPGLAWDSTGTGWPLGSAPAAGEAYLRLGELGNRLAMTCPSRSSLTQQVRHDLASLLRGPAQQQVGTCLTRWEHLSVHVPVSRRDGKVVDGLCYRCKGLSWLPIAAGDMCRKAWEFGHCPGRQEVPEHCDRVDSCSPPQKQVRHVSA